MKIAVLGSGTMGLSLGALLSKNNDVSFIDNYVESMNYIKENGLNVTFNNQLLHLDNVKTYTSNNIDDNFDLVILMTKTTENEKVLNDYKKIFSKNTFVVSFQNGIGNAEIISKYIKSENILCGSLNISGKTTSLGNINCAVINLEKSIIIGPYLKNNQKDLIEKLVSDINEHSFLKAIYDENIMSAIWNKALVNCCLNPLGAILNKTGDFICKNNNCIALMNKIALEVEQVAKALKIENVSSKFFFEKMLVNIANGPSNYPSMALDVQNKRKTEIDQLNGFIAKIGKEINVATPVNETIAALVHAIDNNY